MKREWSKLFVMMLLLLFSLTACSDDDDDDYYTSSTTSTTTTDTNVDTTVSGTAAAGAPIVGTLNIRGAQGNVSLSAIEADGSYTVDVTALTAPFLVWAEGRANGENVRVYSTVEAAGEVANVTPASNMVMAMALGEDPATVYGDYGDAITEVALPAAADIVAAAADVNTLLESVFATLEMPADFDLMNGEFVADGSGFDAVLDTVSFQVDSTDPANIVVSVADKSTETTLYEENVSTDTVATTLTAAEVEAIVAAGLTFQEEALAIIKRIEALYATAMPSSTELEAELGPYLASDMLDDGLSKADLIAEWTTAGNDEGPTVGITFDAVSIMHAMENGIGLSSGGTNLDEMPGYSEGNWCILTITEDGVTESFMMAFVRDPADGLVKWYGNRRPFLSGGDVEPEAVREVDITQNTEAMWSALDFWTNDEGNVAFTNYGIDSFLVLHSSLPQFTLPSGDVVNGLLVTRFDPVDPTYWITSVMTSRWMWQFTEDDGLDIATLNTDEEFIFVGLDSMDDTAWTPLANPVPKLVWRDTIEVGLPASASLTAAHFATVTQPTSLNDVTIGGDVTVSWTEPTAHEAITEEVWVSWWDGSSDEFMEKLNPNWPASWTSTTFDTSSSTVKPAIGYRLSVETVDPSTWIMYTTNYAAY